MRIKKIFIFILLFAGFLCVENIYAQNIKDLESRVQRLEQKFSGVNMLDGIKISAGATIIIQGTANANGAGIGYKGNDRADASYSAEVEIEKEFDGGARTYMLFETGQGNGVTDNLEVFSNVNADADDSGGSLTLTEVWYEQNFDDSFAITFGKINPRAYIDNNEYANDECGRFLADIFKNSPVIESPDNTIGMRLGMPVKEFVELDMEILDGNGDFEQVGDHPYFGLQVNIKPRLMDKKGNYRFIYWLNETAHTKWSNAAKTKETGTGFGVSFDQEVADDIGVFLRAGWQRDEVYLAGEGFSLDSSYSAGFQLSGNLWNRQNDILGIAYGIINPSDEYKKAGPLHADAETHFEAYYNYQINSNVAISPDIQIITKPYGNDAVNGSSAIIAAGIRTQIDF